MAHYINDKWELVTQVLQTRVMYENHTGSNIAALLRSTVEEWCLQYKDPAVVTDNAENMTLPAGLAGMLHFGCFAHILNLAIQHAVKLQAVAHLLGKVRWIISFFRCSTTASNVLKKSKNCSTWTNTN